MKALVISIAALGLASAASAQSMKPMPSMTKAAVKSGKGVGVITAVDAKAGRVTIKHGPIPAVGWPAMTMRFRAAPALLHGAKSGQTVAFDVRTRGSDAELTVLKPR